MSERPELTVSYNNIRSLVYFLGVKLDARMSSLLENTPYQKARPSDGRVFVNATRGQKTISEIARDLHISRQSAQSTVSRLAQAGLVKLEKHPRSKREKIVLITEKGWIGSAFARKQLQTIEDELAAILGSADLEAMRRSLEKLQQFGA